MDAKSDCQIDNPRARVTRWRLAPGASTGHHRHAYDYVIVPVTSGRLRITDKGEETIAELAAGVAYFRSVGVEHDVANAGSAQMVFVEVEFVS